MNIAGVTPRRLTLGSVLLLAFVGTTAIPADPVPAAALPSGFSEQVVFSGLVNPTGVEFAANGQVFVAEKSGIIKVFDSLADTTPSVFADLRTRVHNYWDRGLLGLALHPNYPADPRVYALYTYDGLIGVSAPKWGALNGSSDPCPTPPGPTSDGCQVSGRLSALTRSGTQVAEQVLIEDWCQQFPSHSVGSIAFGPDAMLYATGGDGASFNYVDYGQDSYPTSDVTPDNPCGDPPSPVGTALAPPSAEGGALRSQDLRTSADPTTLDGSLIRIDPDTGAASPGNPLASSTDPNARRIVADGLRNPFRFAVRPGTNEIWIGDVGWTAWEEINRVVSPTTGVSNFGWPCYEGAGRGSGYDAADLKLCEDLYAAGTGVVKAPYFAYHHTAKVVSGETCGTGSSSIAGMAFYPGGGYPAEYDGALFFADYSRKCMWAMRPGTGGLPDPANIITFASGYGITALEAGPGGDIFAVDYNNGRIIRYVYNASNNAPTALLKAEPSSGLAPLTVSFDGTGSNDADGDSLTYAWDLDGDGQYDDSSAASVQHTFTTIGTVRVGLRVSDDKGAVGTATVDISVGNTAPTALITGPSPGTTWRVGATIGFSGTAVDAQDGTLSGADLSWTLVMHHCPSDCHAHEITTMTGTSGTFTTPDHEYPSYLELRLTAEDSGGLTDSTSVRLDPKAVDLTFASEPGGLSLNYLASTSTAPFTRRAIVGSSGSMSADSVQVSRDRAVRFASWSDGGNRVHNFTTPASPVTYVAAYRTKRDISHVRPVTVSSVLEPGLEGARAVDGGMSTRWSSAYADPQWLRIDLGMVQSVNKVLLNWQTAYGKAYRIETSIDGSAWTTVYSTTAGDGGTDDLSFDPVEARFVRIYGTERGTQLGYSLWEIGVFGDVGLITGIGRNCVDVAKASTANGSGIILWSCHGRENQRWTQHDDGTLRTMGKCLDARSTTNGSATVLWTCDGSGGQKWRSRVDGTLLNQRSGRCLDAKGGSSAAGTQLIIWSCHGQTNQRWLLP